MLQPQKSLKEMGEYAEQSGIAGIILAGGQARRMGNTDKGLSLIGRRSVLDHVIDRFRPQVGPLALSANGNPARFANWKLPVLADTVPGFAGPLAGILAGFSWMKKLPRPPLWLVSVPWDMPFVHRDLVLHLHKAAVHAGALIACAQSGNRLHPVCSIWHRSLENELARTLIEKKQFTARDFVGRYDFLEVRFVTEPLDPFFNINTPDDLNEARKLAESHPA